jgi:hypothetical protein
MSTGAGPQRPMRKSQLIFGWDSRYGTLDAYTGQVGRFLVVTPVGAPTVDGRNGVTAQGGHGMPRWEQLTSQGLIPRLTIVADDGAKDVERIEWDWPLKVMSLSIYVKVYPLYTPGQSLGSTRNLLSLGSADTGGGSLTLRRTTTQWSAFRQRQGTATGSSITEPGTAVFPVEVLGTLSSGGELSLHYRDAASTPDLRSGTPETNANMMIPTESWAGNILYASGGAYRMEKIKIARGVQSFASMDLLQ